MENKEDNFYKDVKETGKVLIISAIIYFFIKWLNARPIRWVWFIAICTVLYFISKNTGYQYQILEP
jgi:hypothetical protein